MHQSQEPRVQAIPMHKQLDTRPTTLLPNTLQSSVLLRRVALQQSWTKEQIDRELNVLLTHRLYTVKDLLALSQESWEVIDFLPSVKNVLQATISQDWEPIPDKITKQKTKKPKKKINTRPLANDLWIQTHQHSLVSPSLPSPQQEHDFVSLNDDLLCDDPLTIQNTLRNLSLGYDPDWLDPTPVSPTKLVKNVRFQDHHCIIDDFYPSSAFSSLSSPPTSPLLLNHPSLSTPPPVPVSFSPSWPYQPRVAEDEKALLTAAAAALVIRRTGSRRKHPPIQPSFAITEAV